ncbi:MAG: hypothetical protein QM706_11100 [Nitrospira sp.]
MKALALMHVRSSRCWFGKSLIALLLGPIILLGCTSVVTPLKSGEETSLERPDHGYVVGRVHLQWNGKTQAVGQFPFDMKWRLTDEKGGTKLVIDQVPVDGPFVLNLPAGSYHLTAVSFDNALGIWQTLLPTSFSVRPQECTYVGTWDLTMQTEFFSGSLTRRVRNQQEEAEKDIRAILGHREWPPMVAQLGTPARTPLVLTFQTQGTQLTSPP